MCTEMFECSFESALHCEALDTRPSNYPRNLVTVAILPQGTSWAVADTQAFLHGGSILLASPLTLTRNVAFIRKPSKNVPISE